MCTFRRIWALSFALAAGHTACAQPASVPVALAAAPVPSLEGPIAVTADSWPFGSVEHSVTKRDLSGNGYVEEEYFIEGDARVLDWPALGKLETFAHGPYKTRILVRRPTNVRKFSGTVIVEPLNPSMRFDAAVMWMESQDYFVEQGDIWIGVTVKPVAAESLRKFNLGRYGSLSFKNPLPPGDTCGQEQLPPAPGGLPPESSPQTENGLIWDILSQTSALIRDASGPLPRGFKVSRVYLTGDSQSGGFVLNYVNAIHPFVSRADGGPIFDGYLTSSAGGAGLPMNQCAKPIPRGDARLVTQPRGVPVIKLINQTDITYLNRRADSDAAPDLYRSYEIAGAAHVHDWVLQWGADDADVARTGAAGFLSNAACQQHGEVPNRFPTQYILDGAFANLERWSRAGEAPPRALPLSVMDPAHGRQTLELDAVGNARGGVRSPYVDVPLVRYGVYMDGPGVCELWGYQVPLQVAVLKRLYPTGAIYRSQVERSTRRAVAEHWLTPQDGRRVIAEAAAADIR